MKYIILLLIAYYVYRVVRRYMQITSGADAPSKNRRSGSSMEEIPDADFEIIDKKKEDD